MMKYSNIENVALICPRINDFNKNDIISQNNEYEEIDRAITSGTIMNLEKCKKIGLFDEKMFIDYVDFDYCKRVRLNNLKIIRIKDAILDHEIGKRTKRKFLFFNVYPTNHNENRVYYYVRNIKYYCNKYKNNMTLKEKLTEKKYLIWKFISIILYENNKKNKIKMYIKGIKESRAEYE